MLSMTLSSEEKRGWFSPALFRKNAARFWPLWLLYAAVQFFRLPMNYLMARSQYGYQPQARLAVLLRDWARAGTLSAAWVGVIFGLLYAMVLFSYLMDSKAVGMFHSLPVRREGIFFTNYALAVCAFVLPNLVMAGVAVLAGAGLGVNLLMEVFWWFMVQVAVGLFFFSFAVCCAMFTGHILALPVFYGILNVLVAGLAVLLDAALNRLLMGYSGSGLVDADFVRWCTPAWNITQLLCKDEWVWGAGAAPLYGLTAALGYCIVLFALFSSIALFVYRLRELERAGDLITVGWVRPVFQYGVGVCVGLAGGVGIYERFFYNASPVIFMTLAAVCAVIGALIGRMLLKKSVKIFADGWKGPAVLGVCMFLLLAGMRLDFFGYQRWTPDPARVKAVTVDNIRSAPQDEGWYAYLTLEDPEDVAAVIDFHKALVSDLEVLRKAQENDSYEESYTGGGQEYEQKSVRRVRLVYLMEDGSEVERRWSDVPISQEAMEDPASYAARLQALLNRPNAVYKAYLGFLDAYPDSQVEAVGGQLRNVKGGNYAGMSGLPGTAALPADTEIWEEDYAKMTEEAWDAQIDFGVDEAQVLWAAIQKDLKAGNLGRRYLLDSRERFENCYMTDIELDITRTYTDEDGERGVTTRSVTFTVQASAAETMKALEELGYAQRLMKWDVEGA